MKLLSEFIWLTVETSGRLFVNTGIIFVFHATWRCIFFLNISCWLLKEKYIKGFYPS